MSAKVRVTFLDQRCGMSLAALRRVQTGNPTRTSPPRAAGAAATPTGGPAGLEPGETPASSRRSPPLVSPSKARRALDPLALKTRYAELQVAVSSPTVAARTRANVLRIANSLLDAGHRLSTEERLFVRDTIDLVRDTSPSNKSTGQNRQLAGALEDRLKRTRATQRPETDLRAACQARRLDSISKDDLSLALTQWIRAHEHLGPLASVELVHLVSSSGQSAEIVAEALLTAKQRIHEEGIHKAGDFWGNDQRGQAIETALRDLSGITDLEHDAWKSNSGSMAPDARGLADGGTEILAKLSQRARINSKLARVELETMLSPQELSAMRQLFERAPMHIRFKPWVGLGAALEKDPVWRGMLETKKTSGNPSEIARHGIEGRLFGFSEEAPASLRPCYGYLNLSNAPEGQAAGFGDCVWIIDHAVKQDATMCYGDSGTAQPNAVGSFKDGELDHLILTLAKLHPDFRSVLDVATGKRESAPWPGPWFEVQAHMKPDLREGKTTLVVGAESAKTAEGREIADAAKRMGIPVRFAPKQGVSNIGFRPA